jgi:hypothetical protein
MDLGADMMRDQAHDALAIGGRQPLAGVGQPSGRSIQMRPSGFSITSTTARLPETGRWRAERGAQHPRAARILPIVL